jgi:hypothetical protein
MQSNLETTMDFSFSIATGRGNIAPDAAAVTLALINSKTRHVVDVLETDTPEKALRMYRLRAAEGLDAHIHTCSYDRLILSMPTL